jgi:hypothetical protein
MVELVVAFLLGVILAPIVRPMLRPVFVEAIKAALLFGEEVKRVSAQVKEDVEDVAAEVARERGARPAPPAEPRPADVKSPSSSAE